MNATKRMVVLLALVLVIGGMTGCNTLRDVPEDEFRARVEQMPVIQASDGLRVELGGKANRLCVGKVIPYDTSGWVKGLEQGTAPPITKDFKWVNFFPVGTGEENEVFPNAVVLPRMEAMLRSLQIGEVVPKCGPDTVRVNVRIGTAFKKAVPQQLLTHLSLDFWYKGEMFLDVGRDWDVTWKGSVGPAVLQQVLDREFSWLAIEARVKWGRIFGSDPTKK